MNDPVLELRKISRSFTIGGETIRPLRDLCLEISAGETLALTSPSGSGKSTLLHIAGLLDTPDSGDIAILSERMSGASDHMRTAFRAEHIGFIYQAHHLLPEFTALENVMLPQLALGKPRQDARQRAIELLGDLGLGDRLEHRPALLSGGQSQRVAIARALANNPSLVLADEPTGNLDPTTADQVLDMLLSLCRSTGACALVATHDYRLAGRLDRRVCLEDGQLNAF
jgi:lipoprotein-releasing system ATP-binding protein